MTTMCGPGGVAYSSQRHDWETPQDFFDALNEEFGFDLDAAASDNNAKCREFFDEEDFAAGPTTGDNDEFSMTFTFAASDREALERFVRGVGKGAVSAMILREASKWEG